MRLYVTLLWPQVSWALEGETCQSVSNKVRAELGDRPATFFNNTLGEWAACYTGSKKAANSSYMLCCFCS
jgi:hypothetical protein